MSLLYCCRIYVSEGGGSSVGLDRLRRLSLSLSSSSSLPPVLVSRPSPVHLIETRPDSEYDRTAFTLASREAEGIARAVGGLATQIIGETDGLRLDAAVKHPRLGVVDHISCHAVTRGRLRLWGGAFGSVNNM
jgi:hypothetical protein